MYISILQWAHAKHKTWPSSTHSSMVSGWEPTHSRLTSASSSPERSRLHGGRPGDGRAKRAHLQPAFNQSAGTWGVSQCIWLKHEIHIHALCYKKSPLESLDVAPPLVLIPPPPPTARTLVVLIRRGRWQWSRDTEPHACAQNFRYS